MKTPEELLREKMMKRKSEPEKEVEIDDGFNDLIEQEKNKLLEEMSLKETFEKSAKIKLEELRALAKEKALKQIEEEKNQAQNLIFQNEQKKLKQEFFTQFQKNYYFKLWINIIKNYDDFAMELQRLEFDAKDFGIIFYSADDFVKYLKPFIDFIHYKEREHKINVIELGEKYINTYLGVMDSLKIDLPF